MISNTARPKTISPQIVDEIEKLISQFVALGHSLDRPILRPLSLVVDQFAAHQTEAVSQKSELSIARAKGPTGLYQPLDQWVVGTLKSKGRTEEILSGTLWSFVSAKYGGPAPISLDVK